MEKKDNFTESQIRQKLIQYETKRWQENRGKYVEFDIKTVDNYQKYYDEIFDLVPRKDEKKEGGMNADHLEEPFISLGLAFSRGEVDKLIQSVDDDGSGEIEFQEFLRIITNTSKKKSKGNENITNFFKKLSKNTISKEQNLTHFSFKTIMGILRRENLLKTFLSDTDTEKSQGERILKAYKTFLENKK
jgi:Ca2+-binding EF-hand superfamily protein